MKPLLDSWDIVSLDGAALVFQCATMLDVVFMEFTKLSAWIQITAVTDTYEKPTNHACFVQPNHYKQRQIGARGEHTVRHRLILFKHVPVD